MSRRMSMLKKLALIAIVGSLTACAQPQYSHQPRVYVEQQIIHPVNPSRYAQCEIYLRRYANCSISRTTHDERICQASERNYYNSCMTR
jgi:hypothetical protein